MLAFVLVLLSNAPTWLVAFTPDPMEYRGQPFAVTPAQARPGDLVTIHFQHCVRDPLGVSYIDYIALNAVGQPLVPLSVRTRAITRGCHLSTSVVQIPLNTPVGTYSFSGTAQVDGTFRDTVEFYHTMPFSVVAAEE